MGGMGNQLFQYAVGRSVALKNQTDLKMDVSVYDNQETTAASRKYALNVFNIAENFANEQEIGKMKAIGGGKISRLLYKLGLVKKNTYIVEPRFSFNPEVFQAGEDAYLEGYWQTEKYIKDMEDIFHKEFTLNEAFDIEDKEITKKIKATNAVSLHVRRGDYINNASTNKFHGVCSLEYYAKAILCVSEKIQDPLFFIFSDDIAWVKQNLKIDFPVTYVSDGILRDYEELILMSYCKHNIIANSSFSWWGAWLNENSQKIVVAPMKWFASNELDTSDIIPSDWLRI